VKAKDKKVNIAATYLILIPSLAVMTK